MKHPLIFIEIGRPVPKYLVRNIEYTQSKFGRIPIILVYDNLNKRLEKRLIEKNISLFHIRDLNRGEFTEKFTSSTKVWSYNQTSFWQNTTARFFYLNDVMQTLKLTSAIHIESDVILLSKRALDLDDETKHAGLAYPMQNYLQGCASIFKVGRKSALENFLIYILNNWQRENINDMDLLGEFSHSELVYTLPTWPRKSISNEKIFFDAGSIGKYYLGSDSRNHRMPFSHRGIMDMNSGSFFSEFNSSKLDWRVINSNLWSIQLLIGDVGYEIVNLHLHSKRIPRKESELIEMIQRGFSSQESWHWKLGHFDSTVFAERFISFFWRRLAGKRIHEKVMR